MLLTRFFMLIEVFLLVFVLFLVASCSFDMNKSSNNNLLSIPINSSESMDLGGLNERLMIIIQSLGNQDDLYIIASMLFSEPYSRNSSISLNKIDGEALTVYTATLIFDNIPDDDSIGGYRYDLKFEKNIQGSLRIIEAKQSWRCWQDRGHREFSAEPCL